ncbi:MAG: HAD-IA family hydrolase [Pseudomonadota bacterium]
MTLSFPYTAILFDCDGVLVDSEVVGLEEGVALLNAHGFELTVEEAIRRFTGLRKDGLRAAFADDYTRRLGRPSTPQEVDQLLEAFIECRRARRHLMSSVPGALDVTSWVAGLSGVPMAVASSSAKVQLHRKIHEFGFASHFGEHVYSGDQVAVGKPAPDIFLFAATQLGVPIERCLVIEDSPNGVAAGCAAGAAVWGFTGAGHCLDDHDQRLRAAGAGEVIGSHADLRVSLEKLLNKPTI